MLWPYKSRSILRQHVQSCDHLNSRMAWRMSALWVLFFGLITSQVCSQHWSFGLSPGGKRELDGLSQTLSNIVQRFQHVDTPCSVVGCGEELAKIYKLKGFLGNVVDMENGQHMRSN